MSQRANVTLKISAEEAQAVRAFLDLTAAERDLEIEAKKVDLALKKQSASQTRAAATAKTAEDAEGALATKQRATAAASLQAQKSAALLSDMRQKAAREARMSAGWESALARAQFEADGVNQARAKKRLEETARAQEAQRKGLWKGVEGARAFAGSLVGISTGAALVTGGLRAMVAAQEYAIEQGKRSNELAAGIADLVLTLPSGAEGESMKMDILGAGAKRGLSLEESSALASPLYSTADKDGSGALSEGERKNFDANFQAGAALQSVDVLAEDATNVILAGDNQGQDGATTGAKLLKASAMGKRGPGEFSKSASAISQFDSLDTGLAVTTALSGAELNKGRIPERVKDVQMALSSAQDTSDFSKKHGLAGLTQAEKIAKLREQALASGDVKGYTAQFINQGLDEGKASSVAMLIQQGDAYGSAERALKETTGAELEGEIARAKNADPALLSRMESKESKALSEFDTVYGVNAQSHRDELASSQARGLELRRYGGDWAVNEDGTEKGMLNPGTWAGRAVAMWNGMPGTGFNASGINQDESLTGQQKLDKQQELLSDDILQQHMAALDRNTKALEANSSATQQNSSAAKKSTPVGGAASNAEEKY